MNNMTNDSETNPFIKRKKLAVKQIKRGYSKIKTDTDNEIDRLEFGKALCNLDDQPFIKLYEECALLMTQLKTNDIIVFEYICVQLLINVIRYKDEDELSQYHSLDKIKLDTIQINKLNERALKRSIKNLINYDLLERSGVKSYYWINPYMIFIGNRAAKYKHDLEIINNYEQRLNAYLK